MIAKIILTLGNVLVGGLLWWNSLRLGDIARRVRESISQPILSANPDQFLASLRASLPSQWLITASWLAAIVSLGLLVWLWWPTSPRNRRLATIVNLVWLVVWLLYIIWIVYLIFHAAGQIINFES
jgi:hypothetical protein